MVRIRLCSDSTLSPTYLNTCLTTNHNAAALDSQHTTYALTMTATTPMVHLEPPSIPGRFANPILHADLSQLIIHPIRYKEV